MNPDQIRALANILRMKKANGTPFVLMLGAGASLSSGIPKTITMMEELLAKYATGNALEPTDVRFDKLWRGSSDEVRRMMLTPYLERAPSEGYFKLAELIREGYFDVALTFNYDFLLETALDQAERLAPSNFKYRSIIRGETVETEMQKLVDSRDRPFKVVKLHGSLYSADYFLFDVREMQKYPEPINDLMQRLTRRDVLICGYAFNDDCVKRSFSEIGESIVSVNPGGVPRNLTPFLQNRRSEDKHFSVDFDTFFLALHHELLAPAPQFEKPPPNPFKFLESYTFADRAIFGDRDREIQSFLRHLGRAEVPRVIVITGPNKSGKTSLVRAGLVPQLNTKEYKVITIRCRADIETHLPSELAGRGATLPESLKQLAAAYTGRRVIVFLDQFERVTDRFKVNSQEGTDALNAFLNDQLFGAGGENLTLVLVVSDEGSLGATLAQVCEDHDISKGTIVCRHFEGKEVTAIMQRLATNAGFQFEPKIFDDLANSFADTRNTVTPAKRFTLAHVHAVCHILASTRSVSYDNYKRAFDQQNLDALHYAINVSEFMSFTEDCEYPSSAWLRNMVKVPLRETKERLTDFIKAHYDELLPGELRLMHDATDGLEEPKPAQ